MNVIEFMKAKKSAQKLSLVTCYDAWSAQIIASSPVDAILVGDSLAMVMHGYPSTLGATVELMSQHTAAVRRGAANKFIIGDLPFLANRKGLTANMNAVEVIMRAGAEAVKIEGAVGNIEFIRHCVQSGVPVMGHLGLTPQSIHQFGGFKVQGRGQAGEAIVEHAHLLQEAGCFAVVLECVPNSVAALITQQLSIPTIGIGAGIHCDGQILVLQDLLGCNTQFRPKFLRTYMNGAELINQALTRYCDDVRNQKFPSQEESYE